MAVSWFPVLGMVLFGTTAFLCTRGGLPSGLASALLFDKLSLLISFSSLGISSLNLRASQSGHRLWSNLHPHDWKITNVTLRWWFHADITGKCEIQRDIKTKIFALILFAI